jgi:hypothetical protein
MSTGNQPQVPVAVRECIDAIEHLAGNAVAVQSCSYVAARELLLLFLRAGGTVYEVRELAEAVMREAADAKVDHA